MGRGAAAFGLIASLVATTSACGARVTPAAVPAPSVPERPQEPARPVEPAPEPPPPPVPSPPSATPRPHAEPAECAVIDQPGDPITTVALSDRVDPSHAPRPTNESERLLFRQLYETLVRVDCQGRVAAGLAASWRLDADGRTWIVTLRENARFSDGTPVTPADVRASWTRDGTGEELRPDAKLLVESIALLDDRSLAITLRRRSGDAPAALAHPDLAIARPGDDSSWPLGTRSSRIALDDRVAGARAATAIAVARDNHPTIRFLVAPGDPRDLLDQGVDLLLTRDPASLNYAGTLPQFLSVPLAWQHTHVLLAPRRARSSPLLSEEARRALAHDAVRGEAQGARGPFWWQTTADCDVTLAPPPQPPPAPRIVYDARDDAARDLAERFVGLARASGPAATMWLDALLPDRPRRTYQRVAGLTGEALASARRAGADAGYVMSVDARPLDRCRDLHALVDAAPWLDPETIVPLVDTRLRAIVRRGRSGVIAEWDGGLVIEGADAR